MNPKRPLPTLRTLTLADIEQVSAVSFASLSRAYQIRLAVLSFDAATKLLYKQLSSEKVKALYCEFVRACSSWFQAIDVYRSLGLWLARLSELPLLDSDLSGVDILTLEVEITLSCSRALCENQRWSQACKITGRTLARAAKTGSNKSHVARLHHEAGVLFDAGRQAAKAYEHYETARRIYRDLLAVDPKGELAYVAAANGAASSYFSKFSQQELADDTTFLSVLAAVDEVLAEALEKLACVPQLHGGRNFENSHLNLW
jgi:hypothetical protein